jgi:NAD(P)-dependent dehydrogenase (short-subunit alcohol dehydrogenase family)
VALSTGIASIVDMERIPLPATAYGISKVALNYMARKFHFKNSELTAFLLSPGYVPFSTSIQRLFLTRIAWQMGPNRDGK